MGVRRPDQRGGRLKLVLAAPDKDQPASGLCGLPGKCAAEVWWRGIESKLARLGKLAVWRIPTDASRQLAALAERGMQLQATVQEGQLWMASAKGSVMVEPQCWKPLSNE